MNAPTPGPVDARLLQRVRSEFTEMPGLRLTVAQANVAIQERSFEIADAKFKGGTVTELDSAQAASLLQDTQAQIPALESAIRQTQNTLCILLGIPPQDLQHLLHAP